MQYSPYPDVASSRWLRSHATNKKFLFARKHIASLVP